VNGFPELQSNKNMKMKMKQIFSIALAMTASISAIATTQNAAMSTNAAPAVSTNSKSSDVMTQLFGDPVVAKGKGFEIKQSQLDEVMSGLKASAAARGQAIPAEQLKLYQARFLDRLIQIQLLLQKATDADRANGKKKVDEQIAELVKHAGSQEKFDKQLMSVGMTPSELRTKMSEEITAMVILQRELGATATDAEVKAYYTNHPADFEQPETVRAAHILLSTKDMATGTALTDEQKAAKHKQLEGILKRARAGEDFAKLAAQYSEDPGSKDNGGEYTFPRGQMAPEFEAAAFSLTNNQISDIVTTAFGYHIIKSYGKTPATKLTLTDKAPQTDATIADRLKEVLAQQKMTPQIPSYMEKLEKDGQVEVLDPDLKASIAAFKAAASNAAPVTPTPEK
jgi:parvulin-like peptidyl-prolyl isomerase